MKTNAEKILLATLRAIPTHGWTKEALVQGVKSAGATPGEGRTLFPNDIHDIVDAFHRSIDASMLSAIKAKRGFAQKRVRDKITFALRARLEMLAPHKEAMKRLLIWSLHPKHIHRATCELWNAADTIWVAAGDSSRDYNYYTKRLLLIAVMKSTLSFWLQDKSSHHSATWEFLDRRIQDVMTVGKGMSVIKTIGLRDMVSALRSKLAA